MKRNLSKRGRAEDVQSPTCSRGLLGLCPVSSAQWMRWKGRTTAPVPLGSNTRSPDGMRMFRNSAGQPGFSVARISDRTWKPAREPNRGCCWEDGHWHPEQMVLLLLLARHHEQGPPWGIWGRVRTLCSTSLTNSTCFLSEPAVFPSDQRPLQLSEQQQKLL